MDTTKVVYITIERYNELLRKEHAFETYRKKLKNDSFTSDFEKALFELEEKGDF